MADFNISNSDHSSYGRQDLPAIKAAPSGEELQKAFPDPARQVGNLARSLVEANRDRNIKNARITSKLDSERPFSKAELDAAGLGWKSNFTTRPLATLTQRTYARFPRAIGEAKYLTNAALPARFPEAKRKTEFFRDKVTRFVRSDPRWQELVEGLAWENVVFGYTAAVWLDEEAWLPRAARQDEVFVPAGTKQHAATCPVLVVRRDHLVHEAFGLLKKAQKTKEIPPDSDGNVPAFSWDTQTLARAINDALPEDCRTESTEDVRVIEDLRRQISVANAFGTGRKLVSLYNVLVVESDGRVSHYMTDKGYQLLFTWERRFQNMSQAVSFFAFEIGDRSLLGSKGVGRMAYTMASVQDRSSNDVVDRFQLAGKVFLKAPEQRHRRFRMSVVGNVVLIGDDYELLQGAKVEASVDDALGLDRFLQSKLDAATGNVSPIQLEGERVTAQAVNLLASREGERSDEYLSRWLQQFGAMNTEIVRRLCLVTTDDAQVQQLRAELLTQLSEEEVNILATAPAMTTVAGWTPAERQSIVQACVEGRGNLVYNQVNLERAKLSAQVSPDFAEDVLMPENDSTIEAEQVRLQALENGQLMQGVLIPVSPRDAHMIHLGQLADLLTSTMQEAASNSAALPILKALMHHGLQHLEAGTQQGLRGLEPFEVALKEIQKAVSELEQLEQRAATEQGLVEGEEARMMNPDLLPGGEPPPSPDMSIG